MINAPKFKEKVTIRSQTILNHNLKKFLRHLHFPIAIFFSVMIRYPFISISAVVYGGNNFVSFILK